jgi:hypothetical protein
MSNDTFQWVEFSQLPSIAQSKILTLKLLTNRCLSQASLEEGSTIANPIVGILWEILVNGGQVKADILEQ